MTLTLTILRSPQPVSPASQQLRDGSLSIGRGADNDLVLPDPERHLSKRHCVITLRDSFWEITDLSTNGTFLNRDAEPLSANGARDLRDGDRLRLGSYELAIAIAVPPAITDERLPLAATAPEPMMPREPVALFEAPIADALALPTQPDHVPGVEEIFQPPRPVAVLSEDWNLDAADIAPAIPKSQVAPVAVPEIAPASSTDLLAAFLRGAGVPTARPEHPEAAMEALGAAFRALVDGLRQALIARAALKSEFRIEQTMIRPRGNNPLKFSASDDDALLALLGVGRRTDMQPAESVAEALRDIRLHELAAAAAMQNAVRNLLREFTPAKLRTENGRSSLDLLPQQGKARAWDAFEALHQRVTQALSDDFDSVFGRAFARAYEEAIAAASQGEGQS